MKKFLVGCLTAVMMLSCCAFGACGKGKEKGPDRTPVSDGTYQYDGLATFAPYTVHNEDGSVEGEPYESMFLAIRHAGEKANSKNKMYVEDRDGLKIFERVSLAQSWCYDGTCFVGTKPKTEAINWAKNHARSYVVNGQGSAYTYLGSEDFDLPRHPEDVYELPAGAFSYIFTPGGEMAGNEWVKNGYAYASATVRLSEAELAESPNSQWNAYVFFNIRGSDNCDLGVGSYAGAHGQWKITCNCSNKQHKDGTDPDGIGNNGFWVYQNQTVTTMTKDDDGVYRNADDIFIETWGGKGFWQLNVTNLRTKKTSGYTHHHAGMHEGADGYYRVIVAVSYCPVMGSVWDARAGGYFKNVLWEDVKIARYRSDATATNSTYTDEDKEELFIGNNTVKYCFTQCADSAHLTFGTHKESGTYQSGAKYAAGSKYISFSTYYDGSHIVDED